MVYLKSGIKHIIAAVIISTCFLTFSAKGQTTVLDQKISIHVKSMEIGIVLGQIKKRTGVGFVHSPNIIGHQRVSLRAKNEKLEIVLARLLKPLHIDYSLLGGQIVLSPMHEKVGSTVISENSDLIITEGLVVNQTGRALSGVSVLIDNSREGTVTNERGHYTIQTRKNANLIFTYVGYMKQTAKVSTEMQFIVLKESVTVLNPVAIVGSRAFPRTMLDRAVPVSILADSTLQSTGQMEVGQMINTLSPSFNTVKTGVNGIANYADPATLRGLSPDQMLVLVSGKRRHQFSALNVNQTVGLGTVTTDMNTIPSLAIERTEILKDGASALYGSDAIAGIVNLQLNKQVGHLVVKTQTGITSRGDGTTFLATANYGFALKESGFLNFTLQYHNAGATNRSNFYTGNIYSADSNTETQQRRLRNVWPADKPFKVGTYGTNKTQSYQAFYNAAYPVGKRWNVYSFSGVSLKRITAHGFFRSAINADVNSNPAIYPDGYLPRLPGTTTDYSSVAGLTGMLPLGWKIDLSTSYGYNALDLWARNTTNPSMEALSPTDFYIGKNTFRQHLSELNLTRQFKNLQRIQSLHLALGTQFRFDRFRLLAGDAASYFAGPLTATGKTPFANGRPGISINDQAHASRSNLGIYADLESDITKALLLAAAVRYEHYSDFGGNLTGKVAARLRIQNILSIHGSVNKGFRAPSLQQSYNRMVTSNVQADAISLTRLLSADDPRLESLGFSTLKAENSWNYNFGVAVSSKHGLRISADAYQINITNRIILSDPLTITRVPELNALFPGIDEIRFFSNYLKTTTKGLDLTAHHNLAIAEDTRLTTSLALMLNKTRITGAKLLSGNGKPAPNFNVPLLDTVSRGIIETGQPGKKVILTTEYHVKKTVALLRFTYVGPVTTWVKPAEKNVQSQHLGGRFLTDLSVTYKVNRSLSLTVGSNNVMNIYPEKLASTFPGYSHGEIPYSRSVSQIGFNGAYYFISAMLRY